MSNSPIKTTTSTLPKNLVYNRPTYRPTYRLPNQWPPPPKSFTGVTSNGSKTDPSPVPPPGEVISPEQKRASLRNVQENNDPKFHEELDASLVEAKILEVAIKETPDKFALMQVKNKISFNKETDPEGYPLISQLKKLIASYPIEIQKDIDSPKYNTRRLEHLNTNNKRQKILLKKLKGHQWQGVSKLNQKVFQKFIQDHLTEIEKKHPQVEQTPPMKQESPPIEEIPPQTDSRSIITLDIKSSEIQETKQEVLSRGSTPEPISEPVTQTKTPPIEITKTPEKQKELVVNPSPGSIEQTTPKIPSHNSTPALSEHSNTTLMSTKKTVTRPKTAAPITNGSRPRFRSSVAMTPKKYTKSIFQNADCSTKPQNLFHTRSRSVGSYLESHSFVPSKKPIYTGRANQQSPLSPFARSVLRPMPYQPVNIVTVRKRIG